MFPVHCARHGQLVLLPYGRIRLVNTANGIEVHYRCTCGHEAVERLGALAAAPAGDAAAA